MNLREYETIFILRPDIGEDEATKVLERIKGAIASRDGVILREQKWGKKKLAYEVKKHLKGYFYYFQYIGPAGVVEEFERIMKLLEAVIKFQTIKLGDFVDVEARKAEIVKEDEERAKAPVRENSDDDNGSDDDNDDSEDEDENDDDEKSDDDKESSEDDSDEEKED